MIAGDRAATTTSLDVASAFQDAGKRNRLAVVALGRGAVMAMALDHPRTFGDFAAKLNQMNVRACGVKCAGEVLRAHITTCWRGIIRSECSATI